MIDNAGIDTDNYGARRVLVTGADGFIGSHLTEALVAAGADVTALSMYTSSGEHGWLDAIDEGTRASLRLVRGDIRDPGFVMALGEGQDVVFHLAALVAIPHSYAAPQSYVDTNITGTLNVLEAARRHAVGRVVHTSTSEVYGSAQSRPIAESHPLQGQSPYAASKIGADMMAEAYDRSFELPVAILRPFNTYGPRQSERAVIPSAVRQALDPECETIRLGDLTPERDFNFVDDTVDAFLRIGISDAVDMGRAYNAGSGAAVTIQEVVELIRDVTGVNKPIESDPNRFRPERSEVRALIADATAFSAATGWRANVELDTGIERVVGWWRDRLHAGAVRASVDYAT